MSGAAVIATSFIHFPQHFRLCRVAVEVQVDVSDRHAVVAEAWSPGRGHPRARSLRATQVLTKSGHSRRSA
jgi:hypothetical protein